MPTAPTTRPKTPSVNRVAAVPEPSAMTSGIQVSMIKHMQLLATREPGVISLAQGIPSFETPGHICAAAKKAIDDHVVDKYTSGYGIQPLREAIAVKVRRDNRIPVTASEVLVTHGGIEALMTIFLTLLDPGDELIILTPDYASHLTQARIASNGRLPVCVPLSETASGWCLDAHKLENAITPHTKAILFCNPCNPTGKVYTEAELKEILRIATKYGLFIITDEMYEYFTFDGKRHSSIASFPGAQERTISIFGFSKSYAMTGWRVGYVIAQESIIEQLIKVHDSLVTCPAAISQHAALAALHGSQDVVEDYRQTFDHRRHILLDALSRTDKLQLTGPDGSYFAFVKIRSNVDDHELALRLLHEAKVAVVPGSAFGDGGASHIRISFGVDDIALREALRRLIDYVDATSI